jgi:hypothetical protein
MDLRKIEKLLAFAAAKNAIESICYVRCSSNGSNWHDTEGMESEPMIYEPLAYLDSIGAVERHPENTFLVTIKEKT